MKPSDIRYLLAYVVPFTAAAALYLRGGWSWLTVIVVFGLFPLMELALPGTDLNRSEAEEEQANNSRLFDWLLYLNVPIVWGIFSWFLYTVLHEPLTGAETAGLILSTGIVLGASGINVGHELGHRHTRHEQVMAWLLLLPSLYLHFYIEHNGGHHRWVATPNDPATARKGQSVYAFWLKSVSGSWLAAWHLGKRLMAVFQGIQLLMLAGIWFVGGWKVLLFAVLASTVGFLLLETVNYLEHYGLLRKEIKPGIYERVLPSHSWNSNHSLGRILLYELTRHSDHHYRASRKYQVLRHHDASPQLPTGYPGMLLVALLPPLWFAIMDKRVAQTQTT